jgi:outer membrane protein OmpA-like peptidoglycan-associated protein
MPTTAPLPRLVPALALLAALLAGCASQQGGPATGAAATTSAGDAPVLAAFANLGYYPAQLGPGLIRLDLPSNDGFASGSAEVLAPMQRSLDAVAAQFNSALLRDWQLLVVGHADDRGSDADNQVMSLARATQVARYLASQGTDPGRLQAEGRGEREPLATNDRRYGRELNRRVELFLHRGPLPPGATAPR